MEQIQQVAARSPRHVAFWLLLGNLLIAAVLALATQQNLQADRDGDFARATESADNLAHSLSVEVAAQIRLIDNALATIATQTEALHPGRLAERVRMLDADIQQQQALLPFVAAIRFAETSGAVGSSFTKNSPIAIQDRDYFHRALKTDALVISEPLLSRVLGDWCLILARRVLGPEGQALGIVYAVLPSRHFSDLFGRLNLQSGDSIALRNRDFQLIARYADDAPNPTAGVGSSHVSDELRAAVARNPRQGVYAARTLLDGIDRVHVYREVPGSPLLLVTGLSHNRFQSPWTENALRQWGFTLAVITLVGLGSIYVYRQHRREHRALVRAAEFAKQQNLIIENEWVGMFRVRDRHLTWVNRAVCKMLGHQRADLVGQSTRILYPDEATYDMVGRAGYRALREHGAFQTQTQMQTRSGEHPWMDLSGTVLDQEETVWMLIDIDALKQSEERARHLAFHDGLTGLANRRHLHDYLRRLLAQSQRDGVPVAVTYLDLDGFKPINDRLGHEAGDEFAIVLTASQSSLEVPAVLERCMKALQQPMSLRTGELVSVNCSLGLAISGPELSSTEKLLSAADAAMYKAKRSGKGRICRADDGDYARAA